MILTTWRILRRLVDRSTARLVGLALVATLSGLLEAAILILVVAAALGIATGGPQHEIDLPLMTSGTSTQDLLWVAATCALTVFLLHALMARLSSKLSAAVMDSIRARAIASYLDASWSAQSMTREGSLQETVSTLAIQSSNVIAHFANTVTGVFTLAVLVIAALVVDVVTMAIVLVLGLSLFALIRPISRLTHDRSLQYVESTTHFTQEIGRLAALTMELRVFGVTRFLKRLLLGESHLVGRQHSRVKFITTFGSYLYRDLAVLLLVISVGILAIVGGDRLSRIGSVVLLALRSLGYAAGLQNEIQAMNEYSPNLFIADTRLNEFAGLVEPHGTSAIGHLTDIRIREVSYEYKPGISALRGINLRIEMGEAIGVMGASGSGKSTLLQVLLRLRQPTHGQVLVNGIPYTEIEPEAWARLVTLVPQEPTLMEATVSDNIRFMRPGLTDDEIELAAAAAHIGDEIRRLPQGFQTRLGPRGSGLSGGQKQRITIARALVGNPQVLIMDEPTSALDKESERKVQNTISDLKGQMTLVIVAHKPSALDVCDRLITLADGSITHDDEMR